MQVYRGTLELLDYVFYATVERGKVYETGSFIHNYALTYALGLVRSETYAYTNQVQQPHYVEELTPLNGCLYLTPAGPIQASFRLVQWNTLQETYNLAGKEQSIGYPDWGFARMLRPGSTFVFYLLITGPGPLPPAPALGDLLAGRAARIRLGKFPAKARVHLEPAVRVTTDQGNFTCDALLNWRDLEATPVVCDVVAAGLPTRLITRAHFRDEPYYEAWFPDAVIRLPVRMRFLARPPEKGRARDR